MKTLLILLLSAAPAFSCGDRFHGPQSGVSETARGALIGTALEAAGDAVGCIKGGPPDLSTNKKYMEGYGK